ncbi:ABC transporter substrate-binding protein [Rhodobacter ferrooxidans]|uniref:Extracellular solute-binding protein family 5 n=1 Tax=Rhodobacter ferrooxidans TaxID=371731 RepID=C8RYB8_9RHOB|nr:ABC transporter substrate-binding protein [Rhodobacter sp. SW2]EEW26106.1 extracellular solute-binding protein family 5 [Rhodobacter sp. SW2]
MKDDLARLVDRIDAARISRRSFLNRTAAFGLTAALGTSFLPGSARAEPKQGGILKIGLGGGETTDALDPGLADGPASFAVGRQWGDTLVNVTATGEIEPLLAESVTGNAEGTVWTFAIRQGVKFHNGAALTTDDVVATLKRHSDEASKSGAFGVMQGITEIKADGTNVVVTLAAGNADLPYLMADYHLIVQPNGGLDDVNAAIGTGPYKLVTAEAGVHYSFTRNTDDWNTARGHYDEVELLIINDATARSSALQSGQVHMINRVEPKVAKLLGRSPGVMVKNVSGRGHYVFIMHCNTAPFDNKDLRLALKYAIDRQEMVDKILDGFGGIGNDIPINASYPLFDETLEQRPFDLAKATEHYKASGHDGSPIVLRVADGAFPGAVDAAALFQQSAAKAGIPLEIKREPDDGYWSNVWNVQPFCASYWGGRPVQDQMYSTAYLSTADWNDTKYNNPEFDALILQARSETDLAKRKELYSKVAHILNDDGGVICPMFNDFIDAHTDQVTGWEGDPNYEMMGGFASSKTWFA